MRLYHFPKSVRRSSFVIGLIATGTMAVMMDAPGSTGLPTPQETGTETVSVNSGRPVGEAALQLEKRYGWTITYEDPKYVNNAEIADVTLHVRKDLDKYR